MLDLNLPRFYHGLFVKKKLKERWENYIVIRNHFDIVTFLPPRLFLFTHVGTVHTLNQTSTVNYRGLSVLEHIIQIKCLRVSENITKNNFYKNKLVIYYMC